MVNWDYLSSNMTELAINTSNLSDPYELPRVMINQADTGSGGYLGLVMLLAIFIVLTFIIFRDDGDIRMDFLRSIVFASGFTSIIGIVLIVSNIISSLVHLMWFIAIFVISMISLVLAKKKGL